MKRMFTCFTHTLGGIEIIKFLQDSVNQKTFRTIILWKLFSVSLYSSISMSYYVILIFEYRERKKIETFVGK